MNRKTILLSATALLILILAACAAPAPTAEPAPSPVSESDATGPSSPLAEGQRVFILVPDSSQASYKVDEQFLENALSKLGIKAGEVKVVGTTKAVEGEIHVNPDDLTQPLTGSAIQVNLNLLKTDQDRRDTYIQDKGPQFGEYPIATFKPAAIQNAPTSYSEGQEISFQLAGDLTIRDITKPVVFDVTATLQGDTLTGVATTQIKMSDFGIEPPNFAKTLSVADEVELQIQIIARAKN